MIGVRIVDRGSDRIGDRELKKIVDRIGNRIGDFFLIGTTVAKRDEYDEIKIDDNDEEEQKEDKDKEKKNA